jgi:hypothetical protein
MEKTAGGVMVPQHDERPSRPPVQLPESSQVSMFERLARDPTVDVVKLQQLVELQERMEARSAKVAFAEAFAQMQGDIPVITKNGEIRVKGDLRSRFARFEDIDRVTKPILQEHGFSISHKRKFENKTVTVYSTLMHRLGHSETTEWVSAADETGSKNAIQALGSSDKYGRRYNVIGLLNIADSEDEDDGHGAGEPEQARKPTERGSTELPPLSDESFDKNFERFKGLITSGKKSAAGVIAFLTTANTITEAQRKKLEALQPAHQEKAA